ncbi:FAD-dependent oxidoreductase [Streptomyces acidiscabies]|uniref:FAD-dependent oxidoreductase n=1 Tax=Streptomyces acidiscabies TaxID=42234 RepID=A0AAP6B6S0_9ACTN|nr:FAD-dependent oxidoreductase [Streptomyces acidiscabies]MBP5939951.1 FAD-dependent oxidoreductase [Streptomyces sp. LBUM 1476]MBZ3911140.1 FAD-dependent oxidoreductase [Streptomyces acidiscabies]MDX2959078.1 FAD-dependent oxidoreductase [Streptomyces acidiscabies]MDX3023926.1 FAD-dependent oxidoreductase [Streptomyces acidiscabies]MDX3788253.1 FAD-dependent oxidoreductase [Streptomyces acidiscabies]
MNDPQAIDVLVIGAGPSGSALAIDLVRRGLDVRIVDRSPHAFDGSRAKGIQPRSLEVLEDLGALDDVLAGGDVYPKLGIHAGPIGVPWKMFPRKEATPDVPYPNTWLIPQFRTDRALHARLGELGREVEFGRELTGLTQDEDTVTATVAGEEIVARYAVGADGGSSAVRKQLDIGFAGTTDDADRVLIVDASVSGLARNRWHMWPGLGGKLIGACPLPGSDMFQWMIRLTPDEKPPQEIGAIVDRIHSHTRNRHIQLHEIHWTSVFRPNIRLARQYGRGRVFLVGDAAHVHTPAGAQGLNTGMQDGYNLGWKLGQVLAGADPALLDTYEAERQPIAAGVLGLSTEKWGGLAKLDPSSMKRGKDEQQLALTYYGGPLAPADGDSTGTLHVGDRAPDARLLGTNGAETRLFSLFQGPHFTAIAYGPGAARDLERLDWPPTGARLKRIAVGPSADFSDPENTLRSAYGLTGDTLLLIRPDGYIGHIATSDFLTTTQAAVRAMTPEARSRTMYRQSSGAAE